MSAYSAKYSNVWALCDFPAIQIAFLAPVPVISSIETVQNSSDTAFRAASSENWLVIENQFSRELLGTLNLVIRSRTSVLDIICLSIKSVKSSSGYQVLIIISNSTEFNGALFSLD